VRIVKVALYPTDASFTPPSMAFTAPQIYTPRIIDITTIYSPVINFTGRLLPPNINDNDSIYTFGVASNPQVLQPSIVDHLAPGTPGPPAPILVSVGTIAIADSFSQSFMSSSLPASRVIGNTLISYISCFASLQPGSQAANPNFIVTGSWTKVLEITNNAIPSLTIAIATRLVDGTETACEWVPTAFFNPTGNAGLFQVRDALSQTFQFSGVSGLNPIGAVASQYTNFDPNFQFSINTGSVLTTLFDNSVILSALQWFDPGAATYAETPTPNSPWTLLGHAQTQTDRPYGSIAETFYETVSNSGPADPIDLNFQFPIASYSVTEMEVKGGLVSGGDDAMFTPIMGYDPRFQQNSAVTEVTGTSALIHLTALTPSFSNVNLYAPGDLFIVHIIAQAGNQTFSITNNWTTGGSNWTIGGTSTDNNLSSMWCWKVLNQNEGTIIPGDYIITFPTWVANPRPTINWGTSCAVQAEAYQFRGNGASPIGATATAFGSTSPLTIGGITTTHPRDGVMVMMLTKNNQNILLPSGYTNIGNGNDASGSFRVGYQTWEPSGSASNDVSVTITNTNWRAFMVEIKSN
jgi:hypothetical protein